MARDGEGFIPGRHRSRRRHVEQHTSAAARPASSRAAGACSRAAVSAVPIRHRAIKRLFERAGTAVRGSPIAAYGRARKRGHFACHNGAIGSRLAAMAQALRHRTRISPLRSSAIRGATMTSRRDTRRSLPARQVACAARRRGLHRPMVRRIWRVADHSPCSSRTPLSARGVGERHLHR